MPDRDKIMDTYNRIDIEWGFVWGTPSLIVDRVVLELKVSRDEVINVVVEEWFYKGQKK